MKIIRKLSLVAVFLLSLGAHAATGVMVPYGAGGATDFQARIITMMAENEDALGEPIYILNKPGAGGRVGWSWYATRAPKDGSILSTFNAPHFIAQSIGDEVPYSAESFEPIVTWGADPAVLVVPATSDISSFGDFEEHSQTKAIDLSGAGLLVGHHIAALQLQKETNAIVSYIPHPSGGAGALAGVVSGEFSAGINNLSDSIRASRNGSVKILGIFANERHELLPEVPTFTELGYPKIGNESVNYRGIMVRKELEIERIEELESAFLTMFQEPKVAKKMAATGSPFSVLNRKQTQALWADQAKALKELLEVLK